MRHADAARSLQSHRASRRVGAAASSPAVAPLWPTYTDSFYKYESLPFDDGDPQGFFGYKVLAVSEGGSLQLSAKGATYGAELDPHNSGTSWTRLQRDNRSDGRAADPQGGRPCRLGKQAITSSSRAPTTFQTIPKNWSSRTSAAAR